MTSPGCYGDSPAGMVAVAAFCVSVFVFFLMIVSCSAVALWVCGYVCSAGCPSESIF